MNKIHLHGSLATKFGSIYEMEIDSPRDAIRALGTQIVGFLEHISEGNWRVVRGEPDTGMELDEDGLLIGMGDKPLHIIPVASGAGDGAGKIIVGALMVAAAFFVPGLGPAMAAGLGGAGVGLIVAGATMMMTPTPEDDDYESKERDTQSFLFNGPVNVNKQGVAVPLIYGEVFTGSVVISSGIRAEDISVNGDFNDGDSGSELIT